MDALTPLTVSDVLEALRSDPSILQGGASYFAFMDRALPAGASHDALDVGAMYLPVSSKGQAYDEEGPMYFPSGCVDASDFDEINPLVEGLGLDPGRWDDGDGGVDTEEWADAVNEYLSDNGVEPMYDYVWFVPGADVDEAVCFNTTATLAGGPAMCTHEDAAYLVLTGCGMDMADELIRAYIRLGFLPPVRLARDAHKGHLRLTDAERATCLVALVGYTAHAAMMARDAIAAFSTK